MTLSNTQGHKIQNIMTTEQKVIAGFGVLTLVIIVGGVWMADRNSAEDKARLEKPLLGEIVTNESSAHVARGAEHPPYASNPPTSGWHWGNATAGPGIKDESIADELVIHSMEHGAVVVWYRSDLDEADVDLITEAFNSASGKKILIPRSSIEVPVALTSWERLLRLETIDTAMIKEFIETNNDRAPEKAPI
jgi:hypothetical protein